MGRRGRSDLAADAAVEPDAVQVLLDPVIRAPERNLDNAWIDQIEPAEEGGYLFLVPQDEGRGRLVVPLNRPQRDLRVEVLCSVRDGDIAPRCDRALDPADDRARILP